MNNYDRAKARVQETPELQPHTDIIVEYDWNDSDHYHWVETAPIAEILRWAEEIRENEQNEQQAISQYASALGRRGGRSTSEAKRAASRENGKRGGRPKKPTDT